MPTASAEPEFERLASAGRVGNSAVAGLTAMLLILVGGAAGVLLHHRRRANYPARL
jgi:hypothetical protein